MPYECSHFKLFIIAINKKCPENMLFYTFLHSNALVSWLNQCHSFCLTWRDGIAQLLKRIHQHKTIWSSESKKIYWKYRFLQIDLREVMLCLCIFVPNIENQFFLIIFPVRLKVNQLICYTVFKATSNFGISEIKSTIQSIC